MEIRRGSFSRSGEAIWCPLEALPHVQVLGAGQRAADLESFGLVSVAMNTAYAELQLNLLAVFHWANSLP